MKKDWIQIFTAILTLGILFCGTASAAPVISGNISPSNSTVVTGTVGTTQTFTIPLNETASVIWTENGASTTLSTDGSNVATLNHVFQQGSYQVTASIDGVGQIAAWNVEGTTGLVADFEANITQGSIPLTVMFTDKSVNATTSQWDFGDGNSSQEKSPIHTYTSVGEYKVNLTVTDANGTSKTKDDVTIKALAPAESGAAFTANVTSGSAPLTVQFTDSSTGSPTKWNWSFGDGSSSTDKSPVHTYTTDGNYTVTLNITDSGGNTKVETKESYITVQGKYYSSGNRIWDESRGMDRSIYTWNAQSFSGFYYDLDSGVSSESMTITDIDRDIKEGNIEYITTPSETEFEYGGWGSYQIIGFMAEKYFAGYNDNTKVEGVDDVSLISDGVLSKILIDSDDKESAYSGDSFELEDGYALNIVEVDVNGESVWVQLEKDGDVVDDGFISSGQDYVYETEIGEAEDVPIIIVHFGTVFAGTETSAVFIQGIFQVSDNYLEISGGDTYGEMEVTSVSSNEIKMKNEDEVSLDEGETIDLMGKIQIQVADSSTLRFAPVLDTSEEGVYELRGTVYDEKVDGTSYPKWSPYNFEGFYYSIDEGIGTENLTIEKIDGKNIPDGALVYSSEPQPVEFEHDEWGNFTVVGFMAKKYFAGYPGNAVKGQIDDVSLLSDNILSEVLTDSDDKESFYSGDALELDEGYSLNILEVDINGESVWVQLEKDGEVVDDEFVTSGADYIYEGTLGEAEDIPIIIVHFGTVFAGTETSAVFTEGIFQISDEYIEINSDDTFDEMEVTSVSESGIIMKNEGDIGLGKDETIDVMGDIKFETADSDTLRFYPFVEVETESNESRELKINLPSEIIVGDTFDIGVTAAENPIEGVTVRVNTTSAGKTNADGIVEYTAEEVGTLKITAEKDGYTTANKNAKVIPPKEKMSLNITPETVYVGDTIAIETLKTVGGDPIEGANISIDGNAIGETDSDGKITYATEEVGKIKISATAEGFLDKSVDVNVKDYEAIFEFSNLVIDPIEVRAGKEATITIDAENTGNAPGDYNVELIVNETAVDSQKISLGVGESTTVTFKHSEEVPGTYIVKVGGQEATYTVKEKSSILLYSLIGIILLLVGGIAYMFTKGGWTVATLQAKVDELVKSAKR